MITQSYLQSILNYNPETGLFVWIAKRPKIKVGNIAGGLTDDGYIKIKIDGKKYLAHRLAFLYMTGNLPEFEVDHEDLNRSNNRWLNLRKAERYQNFGNQRKYSNNKSGVKGVCWDKEANKWLAQIQIKNKKIKLGRFVKLEDAKLAYEIASVKYFGEFARS